MAGNRTAHLGLTLIAVVATAPATASRIQTSASITIAEPASVQVINDAPLQALLGIGLTPNGITVATSGIAITGVAGLVGGDGTGSLDSSALTGTTMNGEALSVSVGNVPADTNVQGGSRVSIVIAQFN